MTSAAEEVSRARRQPGERCEGATQLEWLQPWLLTTGWTAGADALRDPLPLGGMIESSLRALCYVAVGAGLTTYRMLTRDA